MPFGVNKLKWKLFIDKKITQAGRESAFCKGSLRAGTGKIDHLWGQLHTPRLAI